MSIIKEKIKKKRIYAVQKKAKGECECKIKKRSRKQKKKGSEGPSGALAASADVVENNGSSRAPLGPCCCKSNGRGLEEALERLWGP